jgi:hypothetical protein
MTRPQKEDPNNGFGTGNRQGAEILVVRDNHAVRGLGQLQQPQVVRTDPPSTSGRHAIRSNIKQSSLRFDYSILAIQRTGPNSKGIGRRRLPAGSVRHCCIPVRLLATRTGSIGSTVRKAKRNWRRCGSASNAAHRMATSRGNTPRQGDWAWKVRNAGAFVVDIAGAAPTHRKGLMRWSYRGRRAGQEHNRGSPGT